MCEELTDMRLAYTHLLNNTEKRGQFTTNELELFHCIMANRTQEMKTLHYAFIYGGYSRYE